MAETQQEEPRRYPCKRCGGTVLVSCAEAAAHGARFHPTKWDEARAKAREAARQRMSDPEFQAQLQKARAIRTACVTCGEKPSYHADPAVDHAFVSPTAEREDA